MSKSTATQNTSAQVLAGLFKAGIKVYKASSRGGSEVVYNKQASVVPHRKGVRFKLASGGSGFLMLEGNSIGTVCFKTAVPALSKLSTKTPSGFTLLCNCYIAKNAAEVKTLLAGIKGSKVKSSPKPAPKPASTPAPTSAT